IGDGSVFTSPAADPVILSTFATFNVGLAPLQHAHFFLVNSASGSAPAQASISGPLLNSSHDGFNIAAGFLETSGGLTGNAPITFQRLGPGAALTTFSDSTLRLGVGGGGTGNFIDVGPNTAMAIDGTIAAVSGSGSTAPWTSIACSSRSVDSAPRVHRARARLVSTQTVASPRSSRSTADS